MTFITQGERISVSASSDDVEASRFRILDLLARLVADAETSLAEDLVRARLPDGSFFSIVTSYGDAHLSAFLTRRVQQGDSARMYFVEPTSFGGDRTTSPAIAGGELRIIRREDDPWREGGQKLEYLLRETE